MSESVDQEQAPAEVGRKRLPIWVIALVVAVVLAGVGFGAYQVFFKGGAAAGECVAVEGADDTAKLNAADCADDSATFIVASKKDLSEKGCPDGAYREVRDAKNLLCLMPNFREGKCYAADDKNGSAPTTRRRAQVATALGTRSHRPSSASRPLARRDRLVRTVTFGDLS